jgi:hypothetical protein
LFGGGSEWTAKKQATGVESKHECVVLKAHCHTLFTPLARIDSLDFAALFYKRRTLRDGEQRLDEMMLTDG